MANKTRALQRSKKELERRGWQVAIVEKWIPPRGKMKFGVRIDVWGFGDLLACGIDESSGEGVIALVQTFPLARWNDHIEKITAPPTPKARDIRKLAKAWKAAGGLILVHGWALKPKDGVRGAKKVWTLREQSL